MTLPRCYQPVAARRPNCELAGFGAEAETETDPDLVEWDYGQYRGCAWPKSFTNARIGTVSETVAGGESPAQIGERADRVSSVFACSGHVLLFSSGHFIRFWQPAGWRPQSGICGQVFVLSRRA